MHLRKHGRMHVCMFVCAYLYMHAGMHYVCVYARMYVCILSVRHTNLHTYFLAYIHRASMQVNRAHAAEGEQYANMETYIHTVWHTYTEPACKLIEHMQLRSSSGMTARKHGSRPQYTYKGTFMCMCI